MATLNTGRMYRFNLFGFSFLIWRKSRVKQVNAGSGRGPDGSCKIVRYKEHIAIAMPNGDILPHQVGLDIKAPLNAIATAKVELFVTID